MKNLKTFQSRPTALIWPGRNPKPPIEWRLVDMDAALDHLPLLQLDQKIDSLFSVNMAGLDKFFPDRKSKLVGLFGDALKNQNNMDEVVSNYFKCGYDIVVVNEAGNVVQHQESAKCKIILRSPDGS